MSAESERQSREKRIDPRLRAAGWIVTPFDQRKQLTDYGRAAVTEYPTENGPADYALVNAGHIVGVVEAKKVNLGPQNVLTQAERYSRGLADAGFEDGFGPPFLYSTNGEITWFQDLRDNPSRSRQVAEFHTPQALTEMLEHDHENSLEVLASLPAHAMLRPYQLDANEVIEQRIQEHKRKMLVTMATGTGKTLTLVNEVYRLMKSGAARRVLFLVDRRALAAQAVRAFASFEAEPGLKFDKIYEVYSQRFFRDDIDEDHAFDPKVIPTRYLADPQPGQAFVYVSTIQRMTINLFGRDAVFNIGDEDIDEDASRLDIPIHAFDLIVADECHRGYSAKELSTWRRRLDHFDGVKVGLTATPAAHTMAYFENVAYRYDFERAVAEGYLVDYDAVRIHSDVRIKGVLQHETPRLRHWNRVFD